MPRLKLAEVLAVTKMDHNAFKARRLRDQLAFAFGQRQAYASLSFLPVDAVGLLITEKLSKAYGNKKAAQIVRVWFEAWGRTVALADTRQEAVQFCCVDLVDQNGKEATWPMGGLGTDIDEIEYDMHAYTLTPEFRAMCKETGLIGIVSPVRLTCINVLIWLNFIRKTAAGLGIDLSSPFMPPPGPELEALLAPFVEGRDRILKEVRALTPRGREKLAEKAGALSRKLAEAREAGSTVN